MVQMCQRGALLNGTAAAAPERGGQAATLRVVQSAFDSILAAARANADWAWAKLYDEHAPRVLQYLRSQQVADPEAVLGDVFLRVVRGIHRFEGDEDDFRGWLYRIAQRCAVDAHSRRAPLPTDVIPEGIAPDVADVAQRTAAEQRVYRLLSILPADQRAAVFLRVAMDMPIVDIAQVLERRESAVKMLLQRGFRTLRERGFPGEGAG